MKLREASPRDLPEIMEVLLTGLVDDPVFDWQWRYRKRYPGDNYFYWDLRLRTMLHDASVVFIIMELAEEDDFRLSGDPVGTIVSFAVWRRSGSSDAAKKMRDRKNSDLDQADRRNVALCQASADKRYPEGRRDRDPARDEKFWSILDEVEAKYFKQFSERWDLDLLATTRRYRSHGAATALIRCGINDADENDIPCCVVSSPQGVSVYQSCGFELAGEPVIYQVKGQDEKADGSILIRKPQLLIAGEENQDGYIVLSRLQQN